MLIRSAELRPRPDPPIKVGISTRVLGTPHTPYCLTGAAPVQLGTVQKGNRGPEKAKALPEVTQQVRVPRVSSSGRGNKRASGFWSEEPATRPGCCPP